MDWFTIVHHPSHRYSVPFFYESNLDTAIRPLVRRWRQDAQSEGGETEDERKEKVLTPAIMMLERLGRDISEIQ